MEDVAPALLEEINQKFFELLGNAKLSSKDYLGAEQYAEKVGTALTEAFKQVLRPEALPEGRLHWNIADRVVRPMLEQDHKMVSQATEIAQQALNEAAGIGIKAQGAALNVDKVDGILNKISAQEHYDDVAWMLEEPVMLFTRAVVDSVLKANVDFQGKAGLSPKIVRKAESKCCKWCAALAGTYTYPNVPHDVYRRHERCRCTVEYDPGGGKRQNVHTKQWTTTTKDDTIESRKIIGLSANGVAIQGVSKHAIERISQRNVLTESIVDAMERPLQISAIKYDEQGRPSFSVTGRKATLTLNPKTGILSTVHPTHSKTAKKLLKGRWGS